LKSSWYLAQALLGLQRPQEAYDVAIEGYKASLAAKNIQTENLSRTVLRAKQAIWAAKETARIRELDETLASVEGLIEAEMERGLTELKGRLEKGEIGEIGFREDEREIREDAERKVQRVREAFAIASEGKVVERVSSSFSVSY
jgi:STIP1 family protein 1